MALRNAIHKLMRAFGLLAADKNPCGYPVHDSESHALIELLSRDRRKDREPTLRELGHVLQIDKSNVSRLCQRLEANDLVSCQPCPEDRRCRRILLTAKGRSAARKLDRLSIKCFGELFSCLEDPEAVNQSLDALAAAMLNLSESK